MGLEIERKFLVTGDAWRAAPAVPYAQGYLNRDKQRTVRVRIADDQAWLTIKGVSTGATRAEFEYPIPVDDARQLLALCDGPIVRKTRRVVEHAGPTGRSTNSRVTMRGWWSPRSNCPPKTRRSNGPPGWAPR